MELRTSPGPGDCARAAALADAELLGEAGAEDLAWLAGHLAACEGCRQARQALRQALSAEGTAASAPALPPARVLDAGRRALRRRRRLRQLVQLLAPAAAAAALAALLLYLRADRDDAPCRCWRYVDGDPGNSRQRPAAPELTPERVAWEHTLVGDAGVFKPLAWRDLIIVGAGPEHRTHRGGGRLVALDAGSGDVRWEHSFVGGDFRKDDKRFPDRCLAGGKVYITDGHDCIVLDAVSGRQLAVLAPPGEANGWGYLTADAGRLYGASRDGRTLFALEADGGRTLWTRRVAGGVHVPALREGRIYLASGDGSLLAVDARTGAEVWRRAGAVPAGRSWVHAAAGLVLAVSEGDEILAAAAGDGRTLWKRHLTGAAASGLALGSDAAYLLAGSAALNLADGRVLWQPPADAGGLCSAPIAAGDRVLSTSAGRAGFSVRAASGRMLSALPGGSGAACDGTIVVGERIYAVKGGRVLAVTCRPGA